MSTIQNINPTRMELQRQKGRLRTAKRGHKLLKDKSDEMIRHFMQLARENKALREEINPKVTAALQMFLVARAQMPVQEIEAALTSGSQELEIAPSVTNIMGLRVPKVELSTGEGAPGVMINTTGAFDESVSQLSKLMVKLANLAEVEKTCDMLAAEIIKIKRRINALEFILMPQIENTIRFIRMKLAENERSQLVRVMKVKANIAANEGK